MKRLVLAVLLANVVAGGCLAQIITFDQLFPRTAQRTMGLHKLTAEEREALRMHVEALLTAVLSSSAQAAAAPALSSGERGGVSPYLGVGSGHWIRENVDGGRFILLEDNSFWQVDPLDRIDTILWLPVSDVTVLESSSGSPGYNYLLINTDDGEQAHARYLGRR